MLTRSFSTQTPPRQDNNQENQEVSWQLSGVKVANDNITATRISIITSYGLQGITYPLLVFRRQCQVNTHYTPSLRVLAPLSGFSFLYSTAYNQGWQSLWRGAWHNLVYAAAQSFSNAALVNFLGKRHSSARSQSSIIQRITMYIPIQCISTVVLAPLCSVCLLEMVQNTQQKIYVSGLPGAWELFMQRPLFSSSPGDRMSMVSVLTSLVLLEIGRELLQPVLQPLVTYVQSRWLSSRAQERTLATRVTRKIWLWYWTSLLTDLILYPLETTIVQLITQGLPMLIDDVQDGNSVVFLSSSCDGLIGYFNNAWSTHGLSGMYRGLSSLILQYGIYALLLYATSKIVHSIQDDRTEQT